MTSESTREARKTAELSAMIQEIRDRVRARHPSGTLPGSEVPLPDLLPILHARDAAEAKVAAIGSVNPRPPGLLNSAIQKVKRLVSRALHWHVREQIEFNRAAMSCVEAILNALNETNRALAAIEARQTALFEEMRGFQASLQGEVRDLKDIGLHWSEWRKEWERKLAAGEVQLARTLAELQGAFQYRATAIETNLRDQMRDQARTSQAAFENALTRTNLELQQRFWSQLEQARLEHERLIHTELRLIRQRLGAAREAGPEMPPAALPSHPAVPIFDSLRFAERFRGSEEHVRRTQEFYLPHFLGRTNVLDIGCGRGEFLALMREAGVNAHGIDLSPESVALCRERGLSASAADLFVYLADLPDSALDGIFCAQVVEHLPAGRVPEFVTLAARKLSRGGLLAIETPNPECLAIFATHFYLDPTHVRPVPAPLLHFYFEEAGFGGIQVHKLAPAIESMPSLASIPEEFRRGFFDALDYAILGRRL